MEQHLLECPKKCRNLIEDDESFVLEQNIGLLRSALHEEIRQRHRLITDVGALRRTYAEDNERRSLEADAFQRELENLSHQYRVLLFITQVIFFLHKNLTFSTEFDFILYIFQCDRKLENGGVNCGIYWINFIKILNFEMRLR